ncbi:YNFM family putative membrane transporter [Paenibacillus castaneae]|uniref:MFS transporter n=1 Tax=Paenibacillus castaneae TaxID=474957 RepID=UPI000C9AF616|nr:MFS transporter [Paenibacillus castaneae]NIK79212.1 YNFM family putative membrane transporter [Paenibacillus castaneae]
MPYIEFGTAAYRRTFFSMLLGSTVTFAILYSPQTLIHTFSNQFNIPPSTASFTISFATFALAVSMLFVTVFSNAWGRKRIMGASLLSASILNIAIAFSPHFQTLVFLRVLQGIAMSGFPAIAMTYLGEEISPKHIGRIMGIYVGGSALGAFIGRLIVSTLTDFFSWKIAVLVLGLFCLLCSLLFLVYLPESQNFKKINFSLTNWTSGISSGLKNKHLFYIYGMGFLLLGVYVALFNYISFPLSKPPYHLSQTWIGFLFVCQLAGSWSSYYFGMLTERYSRAILMIWAIVMALIGSLMTLSSNIYILIIGLILFASGFLAGHSVASGWIGRISPPRSKAYASSLYLLFYYTGSSLIGWSGGLFLSHSGWGGVIWMVCGLLILTGFLVIMLNRSLRLSQTDK